MSSATRIGFAAGKHDAELADADALRLHRDVEVEQHRVVGQLEAFDVKMMLGEADRVVAEIVGEPHLLGDLAQHPLVEVGAQPGHAGLDLGAVADRRKIEQRRFQDVLRPRCAPIVKARKQLYALP